MRRLTIFAINYWPEPTGAACHVVGADLSDSTKAADWFDEAEKALGPVDVLINNAGADNAQPTLTADLNEAINMLHLNLLAPLTLIRHVGPLMVGRRSGTIINIASVAALSPVPMKAWYAASKAGFAMFSEALRYEISKTGVHVLTVYPGPVKTPMSDKAYKAMGGRSGAVGLMPEGSPEGLAKIVRRAAEKKKARVIYPAFYAGQWYVPHLSGWVAGTFGPKPEF